MDVKPKYIENQYLFILKKYSGKIRAQSIAKDKIYSVVIDKVSNNLTKNENSLVHFNYLHNSEFSVKMFPRNTHFQ